MREGLTLGPGFESMRWHSLVSWPSLGPMYSCAAVRGDSVQCGGYHPRAAYQALLPRRTLQVAEMRCRAVSGRPQDQSIPEGFCLGTTSLPSDSWSVQVTVSLPSDS